MKTLFVGGPADGQMKDVYRDPWLVLGEEGLSDATVYVRQRIAGSSQTFDVYAPADWTGDMVVARLIARAAA